MKLSDARLRSLKARDKSYKVTDGAGLFALVMPNGSILWRFKFQFDGKEKLVSFGKYPDVGLSAAREKRDDARRMVAAGLNPAEERKEAKAKRAAERALTFRVVADELYRKREREGKAASTLASFRKRMKYAAQFADRPIVDIEPQHILKALREAERQGYNETAHKCRGLFGQVFRFGVASGYCKSDPTRDLRGALEEKTVTHRAAITVAGEFGALLRAIDEYPNIIVRAALLLLAHTAVRPGEARAARWDEFDLDAGVWVIPAARMKMRRDHEVPLVDAAIGILWDLRTWTEGASVKSEFVFPGVRAGRPISENTLNGALAALGYGSGKHTPHGFRASFSTMANESGKFTPDAIERALAHQDSNAIRRAYARHKVWDERVALAEWWAAQIELMRKGGGDVVPLKSRS